MITVIELRMRFHVSMQYSTCGRKWGKQQKFHFCRKCMWSSTVSLSSDYVAVIVMKKSYSFMSAICQHVFKMCRKESSFVF